jgi:hypothetical protein
MYYSATGTGYISTPSFAIPNTGILTVEAWMKSKYDTVHSQSMIGDNNNNTTVGFINVFRSISTNNFNYYYANGGAIVSATFTDFFLNLDSQ